MGWHCLVQWVIQGQLSALPWHPLPHTSCPTALAPAHPHSLVMLPEPLRPSRAVGAAAQPVSSTSPHGCSGRTPRDTGRTLRDEAAGQTQPQQPEQELSAAPSTAHMRQKLLGHMFWSGWA